MRRWRSSWRRVPFIELNHLPSQLHQRYREGPSSSPTRRNARLPFFGSMDNAFVLRALCTSRKHADGPAVIHLRERYRHHRARKSLPSVHVQLLSCVDKFSAACLGSVEHFAFHPRPSGYCRGLLRRTVSTCLHESRVRTKRVTGPRVLLWPRGNA